MKKSKNPFKCPAVCVSSETSFSEFIQNASFSITSEESTQIISSLKSTEDLSLKSVIFCLAIRKAYKNSGSRYSKFAFYLMRSLYKESLSKAVKNSNKRKISREKKAVLARIQNFLINQKEEMLKRRILNFCKEFPKVRLVRVRKIETITKVFMIFYKNSVMNVKNCFLMIKAPGKSEKFLSKMMKVVMKNVFLRKPAEVVIRVFSFLNKPKHNLPYIKFAQKSLMKEVKVEIPRTLKIDQKVKNLPKRPDLSRFHQKGLIRLCVLNRNYFLVKKKAFYKLFEVLTYHKRLELKNKAEAFRSICESMIRKTYIEMVYRLVSARRDVEYFKFLSQVLSFVKHKCENNLLFHAFESIFAYQKPRTLNYNEIKLIYSFLRIMNTKIFNKRFLAFLLIKGFAKQCRTESSLRSTPDSFRWLTRNAESSFASTPEYSSRFTRISNSRNSAQKSSNFSKNLNFSMCSDYSSQAKPRVSTRMMQTGLTNIVKVIKRLTSSQLNQSFDEIKSFYLFEVYRENCWDFLGIFKKLLNRIHFYQKLESFEGIKHFSFRRSVALRTRIIKLKTLLRRRYTKLTALCFLKWENEIQKSKKSFSRSYLFDASLSLNMYSNDTRGSTPKLLPLPKNIHDYIDDILEVTDNDYPTAYFYPY